MRIHLIRLGGQNKLCLHIMFRDQNSLAAIEVVEIRKEYPGTPSVVALKSASLKIHDNEFFTLLGPSGCGKTTLLRIIAGFEGLTEGELKLFGEDIGALPPDKRPVNTVFQHYSLFPHMTVWENVAFGLRRKGISENEISNTVNEMLALVEMSQMADRKPTQLSGGQQQRVALARALAPKPKVLLLDEPLSALDLKLRQTMRLELKKIQRETGITFVFVTHDQEEALSMSDRIAVMSAGEIQQIGTPAEIYEMPTTRFAAEFVGDANIYEVAAGTQKGEFTHYKVDNDIELIGVSHADLTENKRAALFIRPEKISLLEKPTDRSISGVVREVIYLGDTTDYQITMGAETPILVRAENHHDGAPIAEVGEKLFLDIDPRAIRILEA